MNELFNRWEDKLEPEGKETLEGIRNSYQGARLIPFVGAGLSMCITGFPSWGDLLAQLSGAFGKQDPDKEKFDQLASDPLKAAEFFARKKGKSKLTGKIRSLLTDKESETLVMRQTGKRFLSCQKLLAGKFGRIYTTNYDHLLEIACKVRRCVPVPVFDATSAEEMREKWCLENPVSGLLWNNLKHSRALGRRKIVHVIKFHGDYLAPATMVATESDYFRRVLDVDAKDILLMSDLLFRDILFLGYRFDDISIKYVFHQLGRLMEEIDREFPDRRRKGRLFFVTPERDNAQAEYLRMTYGIYSICIETLTGSKRRENVIYHPKPERNKWSNDKLCITNFKDLFDLASAESAKHQNLDGELLDKAARSVIDVDSRRRNGKQQQLKNLVERGVFTALRTRVMDTCFRTFLDAVFRLTKA